MRKIIRYALLTLTVLCAFALASVGAQTTEFPGTIVLTPETIFDQAVEPLYGGLVIMFGYLSAFIPGINRFTPFVRVLAFALVAGLAFFLFGKEAGLWKIAFTYFISSGLYDIILKKIIPSPKGKTLALRG